MSHSIPAKKGRQERPVMPSAPNDHGAGLGQTIVRKSYRYRIYPDPAQKEFFDRTIGCCRLLYNLCLDQKKLELERSSPRKLFAFDQINELPQLKRDFPFFKDAPANALQQVVLDLHRGFSNFFAGRARFPKFRLKGRHNSFRHPDPKHVKIEKDRIFMPKSGWTRLVMHRPIVGAIRNLTVSTVAGDWFVSIQVEQDIGVVTSDNGNAIGIDLAGPRLVLSDGRSLHLPEVSQEERRRISTMQRTLAHRTPGSRNRQKAIIRLARMQAKLARRRKDALHKATTTIVKNHAVVVIADLKIIRTDEARSTEVAPLRAVRPHIGEHRKILDISPRMMRDMLEYKAPLYGCRMVVVDPPASGEPEGGDETASAKRILEDGIVSTGGLPGMACESSRSAGRKQEKTSARTAAGSQDPGSHV